MNPQKLKQIITYGIYLAAGMPLVIFSEFLSPFHFGKVVLFRSLIEVLAIFYLVLIFKDKQFLPKSNNVFWAITAFTAVFGLTSITSVNVYQSIMGTLERMGGWFTFFHFWLFFVMLIGIFRTKEEWLTLLKICVWVSLASTIYGLLQKTDASFVIGSGGRSRVFGTIGNPALFAGYEILNIFLALSLLLMPGISRNWRYFYGGVAALNAIAVFSTAVRGSLLAMVVAAGAFLFLYSTSGGSRKIRLGLTTILTIMIIGELILIASRNTDFVKNSRYLSRIADVTPQSRTAITRVWAWEAGIKGWNDSIQTILLGWGPENFNIPFSKYFNPRFFNGLGAETFFDRGHNMFVEVLVTMGLLGLAGYVAVFTTLFASLKKALFSDSFSREHKVTAAVLASGLIAYIIHNFFIFDTSANLLLFFITAGYIYYLFSPHVVVSSTKSPKNPVRVLSLFQKTVVAGITFAVVIIIYITNIQPSLANYASTRGIVASWAGQYTAAEEKFQEALAYDTFASYEIRHRYALYVIENSHKIKPDELVQASLLSVIDNVKKNLSSPQDYLPYLYLARTYILLGKDEPKSPYNDLALENAQKALDISPTFIRTYYEIAQAYLNKKDYKNAAAAFQKASELNPEVGVSLWYWGATEFESGNIRRGIELIDKARQRGYQLSEADYGRLLRYYIQKNDYPKIAKLYEEVIVLNPENPQFHASLAATYVRLGRIEDAIRESRIAVDLDPGFAEEARAFLRSIGRDL